MLHSSIKETDLTRNAITGDSMHQLAEEMHHSGSHFLLISFCSNYISV